MSHHGCHIASLGKLTRWLGQKCEEEGIDIFCPFSGDEILYDENDSVIGVRTGDRGIDKMETINQTMKQVMTLKPKLLYLEKVLEEAYQSN